MKPNRSDVIAALVLATLTTLCWVPRLKGPIDLRWDGAAYYVLGTALAEGKGYRLLNEPGDIQSTLHPPMLPTLIALHRWIVRTTDPAVLGHWLRLTYVVFFISYVLAGYTSCSACFCRQLIRPWPLWSLRSSSIRSSCRISAFPRFPLASPRTFIRAIEEIGGLCHLRSVP